MGSYNCKSLCGLDQSEVKFSQNFSPDKSPQINNDSILIKDPKNFSQEFEKYISEIGEFINEEEFQPPVSDRIKNHMENNPLEYPSQYQNKYDSSRKKIVKFNNGNIYDGTWNEKLKMDGYGKYYLKNGTVIVEGFWDNGILVYGRVFLPDDNIYEGEIKDSKFNGKGKLFMNNGDCYEGQFENDKFNGDGKLTMNNRDCYEGQFVDGKFKGKGKFNWSNGTQYIGDFKDSSLNGQGVLTDLKGEKYEGGFSNNYFNNKGKYTFNDNEYYDGDFKYGYINGKGVYEVKDKYKFEGQWSDNLANGHGTYSNQDIKVTGIWRDGKLMEIKESTNKDIPKERISFSVSNFNLCPQQLPNLHNNKNKENLFEAESTPSFLD